jgi:hypothetical protein
MMAAFARAIQPHDLITWMLIKDLADHRLEIARYRMIKMGMVKAPRRKQIHDSLRYWRNYAADRADTLRKQAEREKEQLEKSKKSPEEIDQLKAEIDTKLASNIAAAEAEGRAQVQAWQSADTTEADCVDLFDRWIGNVERVDVLLRAAEQRFSATLEEIDRHLRGLGRLLREELDKIIEGELVEIEAADAEPPKRPRTRRGVSREALANAASPISPAAGARRSGDGASSARSRRLARGNG